MTTAADGVQEITLQTQDDYVFTPDTFTVAPGHGAADAWSTSAKQMTHNFRVHAGRGPGADRRRRSTSWPPGEEETIEFEVAEPGRLPVRVHASTSSWARSAR